MWQHHVHKVLWSRSFGMAILLLILLGLSACNAKAVPENHFTISTIRVVMDENYPPYVFRDEQGNLQGILVDEWKLWEERTGVKVEIYAFPWSEALRRMKAGEFDVIDTIFYNPSRAQIFDFSKPYAKIDVRIFFSEQYLRDCQGGRFEGFSCRRKER